MAEQPQTWFSGLGVLHFLILQTVRKAKLMLWQLGHSQSLSRPAPTESSRELVTNKSTANQIELI